MLARPYLTPSELGIDSEIFEGLLRVRDMLRSGELVHREPVVRTLAEFVTSMRLPDEPNSFSMRTWGSEDDCGSPRCIGGWLYHLGALKQHPSLGFPLSLQTLFLPNLGGYASSSWDISAEMAADAIDRWLCGDRQPHAPR